MKKYETIELVGKAEIEENVRKRIATTGVRGLSLERAQELGLFKRISLLLTAMHLSMQAADRIFNQVDTLLKDLGLRRNEITKACNEFDKASERFLKFWTDYYSKEESNADMDEDIEVLYGNILRWSTLPVNWQLGEPQFVKEKNIEASIVIDSEDSDKILRLSKSVIDENVDSCEESWCVTKYDVKEKSQTCIYSKMDKASALMSAKRLSADDEENIYSVSQMLYITKRETIITPVKAFRANATIGKISNKIKV